MPGLGSIWAYLGLDIRNLEAGAVRGKSVLGQMNQAMVGTEAASIRMSRTVTMAGNSISSVGSKISGLGQTLQGFGVKMSIGVTAPLVAIAAKSTLTAARTETLGVAMEAVAKATGTSIDALKEQEEILKKQGITTQEARSILTLFMQSQLDVAQASKIARVAQDLAVISGENSSQAARTLTNAIASQEPMLLRNYGIVKGLPEIYEKYGKELGIVTEKADKNGKVQKLWQRELTETEKKQALLNLILEEGKKVAGTYETAMTKVGKKLTSLPRWFEEAANAIGEDFLPMFNRSVDVLTEWLKQITKMTPFQRQLMMGMLAIAASIGPATWLLGELVTGLGGFISTAGRGVTALGGLVLQFTSFAGIVGLLTEPVIALGLAVAGLMTIIGGINIYKAVIENWDVWKGLIGDVTDAFGPLKDRFVELRRKWNEDWEDLPLAEKLVKALTEVTNNLQMWWDSGFKTVYENLEGTEGVPITVQTVRPGKEVWADIVKEAKQELEDAWFNTWEEIVQNETRWKKVEKAIYDKMYEMGKGAGKAFALGIWNFIQSIGEMFGTFMTEALIPKWMRGETEKKGEDQGEGFATAFFKVIMGYPSAVAITGFLEGIWEEISKGLVAAWKWGKRFAVQLLFGLVETLITTPLKVADWISTFATEWADGMYNFGKAIITGESPGFIPGLADGFLEVLNKMPTWLQENLINPIGTFFSTIYDKGFNLIGEFIKGLVDKISELHDRMVKWIDNQILFPIRSFFDTIYDYGKNMIQNFFDGINEIWQKNSTVKDIVDWIGDMLGGFSSTARKAGNQVGQGVGDSLTGWGRPPATIGAASTSGKVKYPLVGIGGGHKLAFPAAAMFNLAQKAAGFAFGITDSFRTFAQQVWLKIRKPTLAAKPSRSHHEEGMAIDVNRPTASWLEKFGRFFGFIRDPREWWHFNYVGRQEGGWAKGGWEFLHTPELILPPDVSKFFKKVGVPINITAPQAAVAGPAYTTITIEQLVLPNVTSPKDFEAWAKTKARKANFLDKTGGV